MLPTVIGRPLDWNVGVLNQTFKENNHICISHLDVNLTKSLCHEQILAKIKHSDWLLQLASHVTRLNQIRCLRSAQHSQAILKLVHEIIYGKLPRLRTGQKNYCSEQQIMMSTEHIYFYFVDSKKHFDLFNSERLSYSQ